MGRKRVTASPVIARGSAWVVGGTACAAAREHAHPAAPSRTAPAAKSASGPHPIAATAVRAIGSTANAHASEIVETLVTVRRGNVESDARRGMLKRGPTHFANASGTKTSAPTSCPRSASTPAAPNANSPHPEAAHRSKRAECADGLVCARDERASHDGRNSRNSRDGHSRARAATGDRGSERPPHRSAQ